MNLHEFSTNLHDLAIPAEAREWEMYWRNRIASRIRVHMKNEQCECELYKKIITLVYE